MQTQVSNNTNVELNIQTESLLSTEDFDYIVETLLSKIDNEFVLKEIHKQTCSF